MRLTLGPSLSAIPSVDSPKVTRVFSFYHADLVVQFQMDWDMRDAGCASGNDIISWVGSAALNDSREIMID